MPFVSPLCSFVAMLLCACAMQLAQAQAPVVEPGDTFSLKLAPGEAASPKEGSVRFIGTATVLIRYQGFTILTDPNFLHKGDYADLGYGLSSQRRTNPALRFEELPPIDLVVLSHFHGDHFDQLVQERLNRATPIVSTKEGSERLKRLGFTRVTGLSTWDRLDVSKGEGRLRVTATPARHGPAAVAVMLPTVMGSVLDFGADPDTPDYRIYISGDTLVYEDIQAIPQRFPGIDLALLHLGGMRLLGLAQVTMDGKDAVRMMQLVRPKKTVPVHCDDYDVYQSAREDFVREARAAGLVQDVVFLAHGDTHTFTPAQR
ncbi:MBL fold metallo-hydrolase [Massilia niastensis]|uniref:MBL fold metallo-hydrolase n=1 Tax=Massilia niastensis TaxID=544911 RepID=UPI00036E2F43|nr:MBL fold metallo-hydrolase [Massilia niastensis]